MKSQKSIVVFVFILIGIIYMLSQSPYVFSDPGLNATNITAGGGNVTPLNIDFTQLSNTWQGYFGSVTGGLVLEDASGDNFYDWNAVVPSGEILATRQIISDWTDINCTNQTEIYQEEERLNIPNSSSEGINDTYKNKTHPVFQVAGRTMKGCRSTLTDNSTDTNVVFWNVLLNTNRTTTIYTALIDNDKVGFNGTVVDFQLLVPINKSTGKATYNIYVELD